MTNREDTGALTEEEIQIIGSLTTGGYDAGATPGRPWYERNDIRQTDIELAYAQAVAVLLPPRVVLPLSQIRDPAARPEHSSEIAEHRKRHCRISIYRRLASAAVEALLPPPALDRNSWKRERRSWRAAIRALQKVDPQWATETKRRLAVREQQRRTMRDQERAYKAQVKDEFYVIAYRLFMEFTTLRGDPRDEKIGHIVDALGLGSSGYHAIPQRARRLRPEMKEVLAPANTPTTTSTSENGTDDETS